MGLQSTTVQHATSRTSFIDADGALVAHAYVVEQLKRLTIEELKAVHAQTGVSWRTQQKIRSGEIADPGISHIEKLANFFRENAKEGARS